MLTLTFTPVLIFFTGFAATLLSSMSGGGTGVVTIPVLLSLGIPFPMTMAAEVTSSALWVIPASYNYLHGTKIQWKFMIIFSLLGLLGAVAGVYTSLHISAKSVSLVVGTLILGMAVYTLFKKDPLQGQETTTPQHRIVGFLSAPFIGFYECFLGVGNGMLFTTITRYTNGFDFSRALGYYYAVCFPWCVVAIVLFASNSCYNLRIVVPAALGALLGGYCGSRYAKHKGNRFIKTMFVIIGALLGIKLLLGL